MNEAKIRWSRFCYDRANRQQFENIENPFNNFLSLWNTIDNKNNETFSKNIDAYSKLTQNTVEFLSKFIE